MVALGLGLLGFGSGFDSAGAQPKGEKDGEKEKPPVAGALPKDAMQRLAELLADAIRGKAVKAEVNTLRGEYTEMHYV